MPFYRPLSQYAKSGYPFSAPISPGNRKRIAEGLLRLREQFRDDQVPRRSLNQTLLLASWNIREFDNGGKFDPRLPESIFYIAEILSHFDIIAVQEVRADLSSLDRVMSILGPWWKYIVTDVTYGRRGNQERMAFVYDSRKVEFSGLAGELVLPPEQTAKKEKQFARTPFVCGFKAHWVRCNICTIHAYYGESKADDPQRLREVEHLAKLLKKYLAGPPPEQPGSPGHPRGGENLIALGDFNVFTPQDKTLKAMTDAGFQLPPELMKRKGSNLDQSKFYDQIAFLPVPNRFGTTGRAGVFNFYKSVFRPEDEAIYASQMSEKIARVYRSKKGSARSNYYKEWKTFQLSDHLVLWCELQIDFGERYLEEAAADGPASKPKIRKPAKKK